MASLYMGDLEYSIVGYEKDGLLSTSVLVDMGIKVNKPEAITKIKELVYGFNETYLEAMDFLTNILPIAREKFGRSDNILLPKTPSRKRGRRRNNSQPDTLSEVIEESPPRKRVTRNSKQNNPTVVDFGPARNTRRQQKKASVEQSRVAFVDKKEEGLVVCDLKPSPTKENAKKSSTVKRASSTSPNSNNPVKKRSKSSIEVVVDKNNSTDENTSMDSVGKQPSNDEPGMKSLEIVDVAERAEIESDGVEREKLNEFGNSENLSEVNEPLNSTSVAADKDDTAVLVNINEATSVSIVEISSNQSNQDNESEVMPIADEKAKNSIDKVKLPSPIDAQPLRRSKRLSTQKPNEEISPQVHEQINEQLPEQVPEEPNVELMSENHDEPAPEPIVSETPQEKQPRRSTRPSKRLSVVSTGYKRYSSAKSSPWSAHIKTLLPPKQVEVNLDDVDTVISDNEDKVFSSNTEHSSTESEDDGNVNNGRAKITSPEIFVPATPPQSSKPDSSGEAFVTPSGGKVAELIEQIDRKNQDDDDTAIFKTPNGDRKMRKFGSYALGCGSSFKPPNLVGGNIKSFIKQQSAQKHDGTIDLQQKRLELQRKEEKEREQKELAELRRRKWAEEQKRKREEKQKRVTEAKAAREREEQDRKQRQLAEKKQMLSALEQARKKREHEEEAKKKLREQRTKEAEARRRKENEERLKRLREKEEEENMYRGMLKRRLEQEEQERKQRMQEEKRVNEQKQRERQREQQEERERRMRELKERGVKRAEKEEMERKQKEEMERKEKEEKERRIREQEEREKKRIAQLIKDKMAQEKKLYLEKRAREEKERLEMEAQRKREAIRALQAKSADTYLMTPPPAETRKPATNSNYDISDIRSDESTDDEECPRKKVPAWAQGALLKVALLDQDEPRRIFEDLASGFVPHAPDLEKIFTKVKRKRFYQRTSSAHWNTPPLKSDQL